MKARIIQILKLLKLYRVYDVPHSIKKNYLHLSSENLSDLRNEIVHFCSADKYNTEENRQIDVDALIDQRLKLFRAQHIPFLAETIGLKGKSVLEIGCGTGSSTLALAEQGAQVTAIDLDREAITIAQKRIKLYGVEAVFIEMNALEIEEKLSGEKWDMIIFYASLEHMLPSERKQALRSAFDLIKKDGHVCVFGTPNRLWPMDIHTSQLPFYMWLQDELAIDYAKFSERKEFASINEHTLSTGYDLLYRWGRGVSYHEFESALGEKNTFKVIGSLPIFLRRYSFIQKISYQRSLEYRYKKAISEFGPPNLHPGFYEPYIDLILEHVD